MNANMHNARQDHALWQQQSDRELHADHLRMGRSVRAANYARAAMFLLLGIASIVFATSAHAADIAWTANNAGGEIVLTNTRGKCPEKYLTAYTRAGTGEVVIGCWTPTDNYVLVRWSIDSEVRVYRYDQFTMFDADKADQPRTSL